MHTTATSTVRTRRQLLHVKEGTGRRRIMAPSPSSRSRACSARQGGVVCSVLVACLLFNGVAQAVFPPVEPNVAVGAAVTTALGPCRPGATCAGQDPIHPPTYAVDGNASTFWQAPSNVQTVNLTINLGLQFEIQSIGYDFNGLAPKVAALYASAGSDTSGDADADWFLFNVWAADCVGRFGIAPGPPSSTEALACTPTTPHTSTLVYEPLRSRTGGVLPYALNPVLQRLATAQRLRLVVLELFNASEVVDTFGGNVPAATTDSIGFVRLQEIEVTARCNCNGHATECAPASSTQAQRTCVCLHNTTGATCNQCADMYHRKPWARGISANDPNECLMCQCNGAASSCYYNASFDSAPNQRYSGGGEVCNCSIGVSGRQCSACDTGRFLTSVPPSPTTCALCECDAVGTQGDPSTCNALSGQCRCKANVMGRQCNVCVPGTYALSLASPDGCTLCDCETRHTINGSGVCASGQSGQCPCRPGFDGRRCDQCAENAYLDGDDTTGSNLPRRCRPCDATCDGTGCHGPGPSACRACGVANVSGVCVAACPPMQYADNVSLSCRACDALCVTGCDGPGPTACSSCRHFRDGATGVCVRQCPNSTYATASAVCEPCDAACAPSTATIQRECYGPGPSRCFSCRRASMLNGTCVDECPIHTYLSGTYGSPNATCLPCDARCDVQRGCSGPGPLNCTACATFERGSSEVFECLRDCPAVGFYRTPSRRPNSTALACESCHDECAPAGGCTGPNATDCTGGCAHYARTTPTNVTECVAQCPAHTTAEELPHNVSVCAPCVGNCTTCPPTTNLLLFNGTCITTCPPGYHVDATQSTCLQCHASCRTCSGPQATDCLACDDLWYNGQCVSTCPNTTYVETGSTRFSTTPSIRSDRRCFDCHPECVNCTGPGDNHCGACRHVLLNDHCVASCPSDMFDNDGVCEPCNDQCADGCSASAAADNCRFGRCRRFAYQPDLTRTCVDSCNASQHANAATRECIDCHSQCMPLMGCSGPSASDCGACRRLNNTVTSTCTDACEDGTYRAGQLCLPCHDQCATCVGAGQSGCLTCVPGSVRTPSGCAATCPSGYVAINGTCTRCHPECQECSGPSAYDCQAPASAPNSTGCVHVFRNGACVLRCDAAFEYTVNGVCQPCSATCAGGCSGPGPASCTQCRHASLGGVCVDRCPDDHYRAANNSCMPCDAQCTGHASLGNASSNPQCYGPGPAQCTQCRAQRRNGVCVASCNATTEYADGDSGACIACDSQCLGGCSGPGPTSCTRCARWQENGTCVSSCTLETHYQEVRTRSCTACPADCAVQPNTAGCPAGTCAQCARHRLGNTCVQDCPVGTYVDTADTTYAALGMCSSCHSTCSACWGPSSQQCLLCSSLQFRTSCVDTCPANTYERSGGCYTCDSQCILGCNGPLPADCRAASNVSANLDPSAQDFGCRYRSLVVSDGPDVCVHACPTGTYEDARGRCRPCDDACARSAGCTGPTQDGCIACPTTQYLDNTSQTCLPCSSECGGNGSCTGPSSAQCRVCRGVRAPDGSCADSCQQWTHTHFPANQSIGTSTQVVCTACDESCVNGCSGPSSRNCTNCLDYRNASGGNCLAQCQGHAEVISSQLTCFSCHPQCDVQFGCRGTSSSDCNRCARYRAANNSCVDTCGPNERAVSNGFEQTCVCNGIEDINGICQACHPTCAVPSGQQAGCTGPRAEDCIACSHARAVNGSCTWTQGCPANERPDSLIGANGAVACMCSNATYQSGTACVSCHPECGAGCTGPTAAHCLGVPEGCRHAYSNGACVATCPSGETIDARRQCGCTSGFYDLTTLACLSCHPQCGNNGCTGPSSGDCFRCARLRYRSTCVGVCPLGTVATSGTTECLACHTLCHGACTRPDDPEACVGTRQCSRYRDTNTCVSACPRSKPFFIDCSSSDADSLTSCGGTTDRLCVAACPSEAPFYNDTTLFRDSTGEPVLGGAQVCVATCTELGRIAADDSRCVAASASTTNDSKSALDESLVLVVVVAAAVVCAIIIVVLYVMCRRRSTGSASLRKGNKTPEAGGRLFYNPAYSVVTPQAQRRYVDTPVSDTTSPRK
eukprot:m.58833 g.58833  ORF g.58833 m.58833 type:complete len:2077 (-) comp7848_c0_seq1:2525-8755(-)